MNALTRLRARRRATDEAADGGFSLIEVLVAMSLFTVIGTLALNATVTGFRSQTHLTERSTAMAELRTAAQRTSRDVREADPIVHAQDQALIVRQPQSDGSSRQVSFLLAGEDLVKDVTITSPAGVVGSTERTVVLSDLDSGVTLFTYAPRAAYPGNPSVDPTTCQVTGTSPATYSRGCIGTITLTLTRVLSEGNPLVLNQTLELRNA